MNLFDQMAAAQAVSAAGMRAGMQVADRQAEARIAELEREVLRLRAILRDEYGCEPTSWAVKVSLGQAG